MHGGVEWVKGSDNPRFEQDGNRRVDAEGNIIQEEDRLDLDDIDPGR